VTDLHRKALRGVIQLQLLIALLLFSSAGSLSFWQGWVYWVAFSACVSAITVYFLRNEPRLIQGRLAAGPRAEQRNNQKIIQAVAALLFLALLVVPGLDYRFHWSRLPATVVVLGDALLMLSFLLTFFAFRENRFAAATVRVEAQQRVISTGPYRHVRHPMYLAALMLFIATPIALASAWGLLVTVPFIGLLVARLRDEELYLSSYLCGYDEYRQQVHYRLIPLLW
jgi:protein-S-isoprenylcysteine O-methyltransferase Ste14